MTSIKIFIVFLLIFPISIIFAQTNEETETPVSSVIDEQRDIIRFGTETEIANLIQTLRTGRASYLDDELIDIANRTRNRSILTGLFGFFGELEKSGLEDRAMRAIRERDYEVNETITAAVDYLGRVRAIEAIPVLMELINSGESRFLTNSIRALGRAASGEDAEDESENASFFLLDYYNNRFPSDDNRREIVIALGETRSNASVSFLRDIVMNNDERAFLRISALDALSKIGDYEGLDAIIEAVSSSDPNIRSAAVSALGPFSGETVEEAILEAFRDSFWRTRIGAAQAAGMRQMESAVPFLRFRAENDEVPQVRDEAIRALGAINTAETIEILDNLFTNRRNSDRIRLMAGEMLLLYQAEAYSLKITVEMEDARTRNQTPLYNGFVRILTTAVSSSLEDTARRLLETGGVIERSLALDMVMNNEFHSLADNVRTLLDEQRHGASLARKARLTLERLGLE